MKYLVFLLLFIVSWSNAQVVKNIDEKMESIDSLTLAKKCNQRIFKCLKYDTDTLVINKILYKYNFGKLNQEDYKKIIDYLSTTSQSNIESNKTIIVRYYDTLKSFSKLLKEHSKHPKEKQKVYTDTSKTKFYYLNPHKFNRQIFEKNRNKFIKDRNKCIKKYDRKYNTQVFHAFDYDSNVSGEYIDFNWIPDNGILKETFFEIVFNYWAVILKPDGEYFLIGDHFSDKNVSKLIKSDDWTQFKLEWNETLYKYPINGIGIFKDESEMEHIKHCF